MNFYYPCQFAEFSSKWQPIDELIAMSKCVCVYVLLWRFVYFRFGYLLYTATHTTRLDNIITKWIFVQWTHRLYFAMLTVYVYLCACVCRITKDEKTQDTYCKSSNFARVRESHAMRLLSNGNSDNHSVDILALVLFYLQSFHTIIVDASYHFPPSKIVFIDANKFGILQPNHQSIWSDMIPVHDAWTSIQNNVWCNNFENTWCLGEIPYPIALDASCTKRWSDRSKSMLFWNILY